MAEPSPAGGWLDFARKTLETVLGILAGTLMAAMTLLVFANVVARYGLSAAIGWSEEVARFMFIWMALLGAVLAFVRNEHLGLDLVVKSLPPMGGKLVQLAADTLVVVALGFVTKGGIEMTADSLESGWVSSAVPIPYGYEARIAPQEGPCTGGGRGAGMLTVFLVALFAFVLMNVPIAFALILVAIILMYCVGNVSSALLIQNVVRGVDSFPLMAIPFFMLSGELMNAGGISKRIVLFAHALLGHVRGGLGYVTVVASMIFAGVSGSAVADTSAIGSILYPVMKDEEYDPRKSAALFSAAGCIGPVIPPSIPMILFGVIGSVSIVKMFLGGIIPGFLIGVGLMVGWNVHARKKGYKSGPRPTVRSLARATVAAFWALILPAIILGGIIFGVYTPTEAGVIAAVYAFFVSTLVYRELKLKDIPRVLVSTVRSTSVVMLVCGAATAAAYYITVAQVPAMLMETLVSLAGDSRLVFMLVVNVLMLLVGCVMDLTPALLILGPILLPIALKFGVDPVYFGVVVVVNLCIGLITPPVGNVLYVGCGVSKVKLTDLARAIFPNILIMTAVLFLITYLPWTITFIPNLLSK
jgi:tripartite ATP-independent transporter DctM subunit